MGQETKWAKLRKYRYFRSAYTGNSSVIVGNPHYLDTDPDPTFFIDADPVIIQSWFYLWLTKNKFLLDRDAFFENLMYILISAPPCSPSRWWRERAGPDPRRTSRTKRWDAAHSASRQSSTLRQKLPHGKDGFPARQFWKYVKLKVVSGGGGGGHRFAFVNHLYVPLGWI